MAIRRSSGDISVGTPAPTWFVSYSDLVTQLTVFFVMLFSLGGATTKSQLEQIQKRIRDYAQEQHIENYLSAEIDTRGLVVSMSDQLMFKSGQADMASESARTHMKGISAILLDYPNFVRIEGHTDNRRIHNEQFPSNWELSTVRATTISRYLIEDVHFPPERLSCAGYAEYHPVAPNDSEEGMGRNRRVDIVVRSLTLEQQKAERKAHGMEGKEFQKVKPEAAKDF